MAEIMFQILNTVKMMHDLGISHRRLDPRYIYVSLEEKRRSTIDSRIGLEDRIHVRIGGFGY